MARAAGIFAAQGRHVRDDDIGHARDIAARRGFL